MEPSLRSSNQRGSEFNPRRPQPVVHEAIQSFVESCWGDLRISQYADINYAARRLSSEKGYWLDPIAGRVGWLVFLPRQPVIWIDEQFKTCLRLFLRVRSPIYEKKSVFIATLDRTEGLLRLEDCALLRGVDMRSRPFSERWDELCDFYGNSFKEDLHAQQGLRVEIASYKPLTSALEWSDRAEPPAMMLWQPEIGPRRFRIQIQAQPQAQAQAQPQAQAQAQAHAVPKPQSQAQVIPKPQAQGVLMMLAVPHPTYPDTYDLSHNGVKKGYAAVQDLALSQELRAAAAPLRVNVSWNADFSMYQILSLTKADG